MTDLYCLLAGLAKLLAAPLMLLIWHKKTRAGILAALAALAVCFPVFMIANAVRSGFSYESDISYYIQRGLLYGIAEEGIKFLMLRFVLTAYITRKEAVSYAIGHGAYEELGSGIACLKLIGTGEAAADMLWVNLFGIAEGMAFVISQTVIIYYGIVKGRSKVTLPAAMLLHAVSNFAGNAFIFPVSVTLRIILTAGGCIAAYFCWKALKAVDEDGENKEKTVQ